MEIPHHGARLDWLQQLVVPVAPQTLLKECLTRLYLVLRFLLPEYLPKIQGSALIEHCLCGMEDSVGTSHELPTLHAISEANKCHQLGMR